MQQLNDYDVALKKVEGDKRVLELLAQSFPDVSSASSEIMNLEAILSLPKGTEHFVADLHGDRKSTRLNSSHLA